MATINLSIASPDFLPVLRGMLLESNQLPLRTDLGFIPDLADLRRQTFDDPDFEPELFLLAHYEGEVAGCILAIRRPWKEGREKTGFIKWLLVREVFRRNNIGTTLLQQCEQTLSNLGVRDLEYGAAAPRYLFPGVPAEDMALQALLKKAGWHHFSDRISLAVKPEQTTTVSGCQQLEKAYAVLPVPATAAVEIKDFIARTFSDSWALETAAALNPNAGPGVFCLLARERKTGACAGFAAMGAANPGWFGPMGVAPEHRRKGLGRLLVCRAVKQAERDGISRIILPWVNEKAAFYERALGQVDFLRFYKTTKHLRRQPVS